MAFDISGLQKIGGSKSGQSVWHYKTTDALLTVDGAGGGCERWPPGPPGPRLAAPGPPGSSEAGRAAPRLVRDPHP